jgi:energy-coupling factor transporter ATP-binding protein EcfA2
LKDTVEVVSWNEFQTLFKWRQGEHVSLIGSTGCGKTTLAHHLLPQRSYVVVLATKPRDSSMNALLRDGYHKSRDWPPPPIDIAPKIVLWPKCDTPGFEANQKAVFTDALNGVYRQGGWTVYADELYYLTNDLRITRPVNRLWQQGRSIGISLVASMQRPSHVPLNAYTQATHIFFWRANDTRDLKTIGGIGSVDSRVIQSIVGRLPGTANSGFPKDQAYAFLYVNVNSGRLIVSRVDLER